jgi:N-acyl-D-aspartate/D-glutamate deacylase
MRKAVLVTLVSVLAAWAASAEQFDLVLKGGRVVDPETGLDAVRDVGVRGDRIARISMEPLDGVHVIDVRGLVVAPGFIDLHQHQQDSEAYRLKALDGVTTALELESGVPDLARFLEARRGKALINYGATASHEAARVIAWKLPLTPSTFGPDAAVPDPPEGPVTNEPASPERLGRLLEFLRAALQAGALGIGVGLEYTPGATRHELIEVFRLAAEFGRPVFIHIRSGGKLEPGSNIESMGEVIGAAAITGAPLHVVHINSMCAGDAPECLSMIAGARARGLDVTTEAYPYGAFMTFVNSAAFSSGWRERWGMDYGDVELPETGERLTKERFDQLHSSTDPIVVLGHQNPDDVVDAIVKHPLVMIASDGLKQHPRNAGTFARVLGRHVRSQGSLTLLDAVRKMSLMPAQRLEAATPAARRKGRLQPGADADIVVFDLQRIEDKATFRVASAPSVGVRYLLVAGTLVVDDGRLVEGVAPGRPILAEVPPR